MSKLALAAIAAFGVATGGVAAGFAIPEYRRRHGLGQADEPHNGDGYVGNNITPLHFNSIKFYGLVTSISGTSLRAITA